MRFRKKKPENEKLQRIHLNIMKNKRRDAIFHAIFCNDLAAVRQLAANGNADAVDEMGDFALTYAIARENMDAAKILLEHGADPLAADYPGDNALHVGARRGNIELVRLLLDYQKDLDATGQDGFSAINYAMAFNHFEIARILHEAGASIDIPDFVFHMTARQWAIVKKCPRLFE